MKKLLLSFISIFSLLSLNLQAETTQHWVGGDISLLPSYEKYNTPYYDASGNTIGDVVTYVHDECGWNACRVRLFVNPTERTSGAHTGVVQDLAYVKKLGKRIKDAGMKLMVDFHYSDCWADPSYQDIPASWKQNTSNEALADSMYQYTKRCLTELKAYGAEPDFVQVGNEISYGMLWRSTGDKVYPSQAKANYSTQWARLSQLLNSGCSAVREVCPDCKIVIHTERSGVSSQTVNFYNYISDVDYDIIGLSYYPFFHNTLSNLGTTLTNLQNQFPKSLFLPVLPQRCQLQLRDHLACYRSRTEGFHRGIGGRTSYAQQRYWSLLVVPRRERQRRTVVESEHHRYRWLAEPRSMERQQPQGAERPDGPERHTRQRYGSGTHPAGRFQRQCAYLQHLRTGSRT